MKVLTGIMWLQGQWDSGAVHRAGRPQGHLLQLNDSRLFFGLLGSPRTGFIGFMGILWLADPDQIDRERNDLLPVNVGNHSPDARTGSDELESDSDRLDDLKQGLALRGRELGQFRQIAPEQLQRDIKRLHSRLDGHLDLQGMQDLSQDHGGPELGSNDLHLRTPEKAESQMIFKQAKS